MDDRTDRQTGETNQTGEIKLTAAAIGAGKDAARDEAAARDGTSKEVARDGTGNEAARAVTANDAAITDPDCAVAGDRELTAIVRHFSGARVLVVGDIILDRYRMGDAHRLSPEAPIPVLRPTRQHDTLGGAANVAMNVVTLGGRAILAGVIGDDDAGHTVSRLLHDQPRLRSALIVAPGRPTTAKTRFIAGSQQLLRLDEETTAALDEITAAALSRQVEAALAEADVVILSDYAKGVLCDAGS